MIDWSKEWVIKGIKRLNEWLRGEWVNEKKWISEWIVLFEKNGRMFVFLHFCLSKETPKHGSSSTRWLDVKAKPLATLKKYLVLFSNF